MTTLRTNIRDLELWDKLRIEMDEAAIEVTQRFRQILDELEERARYRARKRAQGRKKKRDERH